MDGVKNNNVTYVRTARSRGDHRSLSIRRVVRACVLLVKNN
uniref:Uncharacterized protein n=1 Tax=Zea mays TaxID=4577 RepID=B4FJS0_MAIZE|nr:unknown [Zea mays]ACR37124.1 unknown [Zea mays]